MNFFITGTDTDVGKTVVTAGIASFLQKAGHNVAVYKPVQSGALEVNNGLIAPDLDFINKINPNISTKSSYQFIPPVAPSLAASITKTEISISKIEADYKELSQKHDNVLVEGAGGIFCPIYNKFTIKDLIKLLNLPLLIVARPDLGTINHTLLTIEVAKHYNIEILGVVISNYPTNTNDISIKTAPSIIHNLSGVEILGLLPQICDITANPDELAVAVGNNINLNKIIGDSHHLTYSQVP